MSKVKKQAAKKLSRQIKCVKMVSEPLTDEQNTIMQVAMETRLPVINDFYGRYSGIQSLGHLDARKIRDDLKSEKPSEQFGCTVRLWTMVLFDVIVNIKSAWSNLANRIKVLIKDNDNLDESEKNYLRYVVKSSSVWGDILCNHIVQKQSASYRKLVSAVNESRIAHLHDYLRRITRREKAKIPHSSTCRTLYLDDTMYDFSKTEEDGHTVYLFSFSPGTENQKRITVRLKGPFCYVHRGNIRVVWDGQCISIHKTIRAKCRPARRRRKKVLGIDKGYSTLLSCSSGKEYGEGFGDAMNAEANRRCVRSKQRNRFIQKEKNARNDLQKVRAAMKSVHDPEILEWLREMESRLHSIADRTKARHVGSERYSAEEHRRQERLNSDVNHVIRTMIASEEPSEIVKEDLKFTKNSRKGPRFRQKMSSWIKGYLDERLEYICDSFAIKHTDVNPAYTSQYCDKCGEPIRRSGKHHETATCPHCGSMNANTMAAVNILHRLGDKEITVFTPYKKVKNIMEARRHTECGTCGTQTA